jgi:branched-chain amino acid transport system substrate-binding protein
MKNKKLLSGLIGAVVIGFLLLFGITSCKKKEPETIKIGAILPLTGSAAEWGENQKEGMEIAIEEINESRGVNSKKLVLVVEDNKSESKSAINAFNKMIMTDKIPVIFTLQSSVSMSLAPIANKNKIVLIASAAHPDILKFGDYVFRCYPTSRQLTEVLIKEAMSQIGFKEVYILYINDDYGISMKEIFKQIFSENGGKVIGEDSFEKEQFSFRSQISKILSKKVKTLYIPGYGKALGKLLKQLKEMKYSGKVISTQEVSYTDVLSIAGEAAEGIVYVDMPFDAKSEEKNVHQFVKKFKEKYGREPILDALIGYDMTKMIAQVIQENGYSADKIKEGLLGVKEFKGILGNLKVLSSREIMYPLVLKTIKNGKPTLYQSENNNTYE